MTLCTMPVLEQLMLRLMLANILIFDNYNCTQSQHHFSPKLHPSNHFHPNTSLLILLFLSKASCGTKVSIIVYICVGLR